MRRTAIQQLLRRSASAAAAPSAAPVFPTPVTQFSKLPNGLRVATQETYMPMACFGFVIEAGSSHEWALQRSTGVSHALELLAFRGTRGRDYEEMLQAVERMGGMVMANSSREQMLYCVDVLGENIDLGMELLAEVCSRECTYDGRSRREKSRYCESAPQPWTPP